MFAVWKIFTNKEFLRLKRKKKNAMEFKYMLTEDMETVMKWQMLPIWSHIILVQFVEDLLKKTKLKCIRKTATKQEIIKR